MWRALVYINCIDSRRRVDEGVTVEELCLSIRPRQCILQVTGNTLQQVETFQYLGVVLTSDGSRNEDIDTQI